MTAEQPRNEETAIRETLLDRSLDDPPAPRGLDMRLQRDTVHARLFGSAAEHRIGRYLVHGTLGQGGMGKVLRAHDETLGRDVALKVLHDGRAGTQEQRLLREAQALARLAHPNVVRVYDVSEVDGRLCMAMELVQGTPLDRWQRRPRPWTEVLEVYLQAGRGLVAAHAQGLVHRDFKPANCILDEEGTVKVLDFGLARGVGAEPEPGVPVPVLVGVEAERTHETFTADESVRASRSQRMLDLSLTRTGAMLGTLAYMAPEQLMGKAAEPGSDQFSFCMSLHEALYGVRPFAGSTPMSILYAIQSQVLVAPAGRPGLPPVPKWLHEVLRRGLSVASHQRYPSMEALLGAIERGLTRRRRVRIATLSGVLAIGLGGALAASGMLQGERPCDGLRDAPMPAWTAEDRRRVGEAIERSGLPDAAQARNRIEQRLDAYASAWTEARADACEATWIRHEAGEQALARRMACLDDRLAYVRATVGELARADARVAAHAVGALEEMPALEPCANVEALLRGPAPVPDEHAEQAAEIRELIARSWAIGATGHDERGMDAAEHAVEAAEAIPEAPGLRLEALYNRGHLRRVMRRWVQARQDLEAALELAERLDDSMRAIDVLSELILVAEVERDVSAANAWLAAIRGKLARHEDQPRLEALRWRLEGLVALRSGRLDEALAAAERAIEHYDALEPGADAAHVEALMMLAETHRMRNELDAARAANERALHMAEDRGHVPLLAMARSRLGYVHFAQGRLDQARTHVEAALATYESFERVEDAAALRSRLLLAHVLRLEGDIPAALEQASRAARSLDDQVPPMIRAEVANLLGSLHQVQEEWDAAILRYREARVARESTAMPDRVELAMLDSNIADCLAAKGDHEAALALYDRALAALMIDAEPDDPRWAYPMFGRGLLLLRTGDREGGITNLRGVLARPAALTRDPSLAAELRWELGQALGASPTVDRERSREAGVLVREARAAFEEAGFTDRVTEIDTWLERCGLPCASPPQTSKEEAPEEEPQ